MTTTSLMQALQAMVCRRVAGAEISRYIAVLSEAEPIIESLDAASIDVADVTAAYRAILGQSNMARATRYNRIYRLTTILNAAIEDGIVVPTLKVSDFPQVEKPEDEVGKRLYKNLMRFQVYCGARKVPFNSVDEAVVGEYLAHLKENYARCTAEVAYNDLARFWELAGFASVTFQPFTGKGKDHYGLPGESWPGDWREPMAAFRAAAERGVATPEYGTWKKAIGPTAAEQYEKVVGYLAGYVILTGGTLQEQSLRAFLSRPANVIGFIEWHIKNRCGGVERCYHASWLGMFARLDKFFGKRDAVQPKYIEAWESLEIELVREMIDTDSMSLHLLFNAAEDAAEEAILTWNNGEKNTTAAIRCRSLLMFALLVHRPLRASNLTGLQFGTGVFKSGPGDGDAWQIRVKAADFKGRRFWEGPWPAPLTEALLLYKHEVQPVIAAPDNPIVFPSKSGRRLSDPDLYDIIVAISQEKLGRSFTPHQFRALVGTLYILEYPDEVWTIQHLLGHRFLTTTLQYYIHVTARQASRRAGAFVHDHCEAARQVGQWRASEEFVTLFQ